MGQDEKPKARRGAAKLLSAVAPSRSTEYRKPGRYADGDRLFLDVREIGKREWLFRYLAPSGRKHLCGGRTVFTNLFNRVHQTPLDFPAAPSL